MLQALTRLISSLALAVGLISAADALLRDDSSAASTVRWLICLLVISLLVSPGAELISSISSEPYMPEEDAEPMEKEMREGIYASALAYIRTYERFEDAEIIVTWKPGQAAHMESMRIYVSFDALDIDPKVSGIKNALARIYNMSSDDITLHRR